MYYMGVPISQGERQFLGVVRPTKNHWKHLLLFTQKSWTDLDAVCGSVWRSHVHGAHCKEPCIYLGVEVGRILSPLWRGLWSTDFEHLLLLQDFSSYLHIFDSSRKPFKRHLEMSVTSIAVPNTQIKRPTQKFYCYWQ